MDKTGFWNKTKRSLGSRETLSVLIILSFLILALSSIFISPQLYKATLREGDISLKGIYAPYDFTYQWDVNEEATEKARDAAVSKVPFYLKRETAAENTSKGDLESFFKALSVPAAPGETVEARIEALRGKTGVDVGDKNAKVLLESPDRKKLQEASLAVMKNVFDIGYIGDPDFGTIKNSSIARAVVLNEETGLDSDRKTAELLAKQELKSVLEDFAAKEVPSDRKERQALIALVSATLEPNIKMDEKRLISEREAAAGKIEPVYNVWTVKKNELVIEKGGRINARHVAQMSQLMSLTRPGRTVSFFFCF